MICPATHSLAVHLLLVVVVVVFLNVDLFVGLPCATSDLARLSPVMPLFIVGEELRIEQSDHLLH